jgi:hypothetical protein
VTNSYGWYEGEDARLARDEGFKAGYAAAMAEILPHLNQLAKQLQVAPVGDLTAQMEGAEIGAVQARIG